MAINNQGHVEMSICSTEELMLPPWPNFDNSQQLPPLLEVTLVQDVPQEPVYNAVQVSDTQDNDVHGWSRISLKLRAVILGSVLVAVALAVVVVVGVAGAEDRPPAPILTSTSSTTTETNVLTTTTSTVSGLLAVCWLFFCPL